MAALVASLDDYLRESNDRQRVEAEDLANGATLAFGVFVLTKQPPEVGVVETNVGSLPFFAVVGSNSVPRIWCVPSSTPQIR